VQPSRRLTARELFLPWAVPSFTAHCYAVNHPAPALGTPVAAGACSKGVNAGSCPYGPKLVIAAQLAKKPHNAGESGMPAKSTGLPPTANNTAVARTNAIAAVSDSDPALPSQRPQPLTSSLPPRQSSRRHFR